MRRSTGGIAGLAGMRFGQSWEKKYEDETGDRQAVSTAVSDDRVSQHLVRDCLQLLSSCCKTTDPCTALIQTLQTTLSPDREDQSLHVHDGTCLSSAVITCLGWRYDMVWVHDQPPQTGHQIKIREINQIETKYCSVSTKGQNLNFNWTYQLFHTITN